MNKTKTMLLMSALVIMAGCQYGHFDKYNPDEAYEKYIEANRQTAAAPNFMREAVVFPAAHQPGNRLPGFTVISNTGEFLSTFDCDNGAYAIIVSKRSYVSDVGPWIKEIVTRYGPGVTIIPVLSLSEEQESKWNRYVIRPITRMDAIGRYKETVMSIPGLPSEVRKVGIDWRGAARDALSLRGGGPFIIVANNGIIKGFYYGRATAARILALRATMDTVVEPVMNLPIRGVDETGDNTKKIDDDKPLFDDEVDDMLAESEKPDVPAEKPAPVKQPEEDADILELLK